MDRQPEAVVSGAAPSRGRRPRTLLAAAVLAAVALTAGVLALTTTATGPPGADARPAERERAVLVEPHLVRAGSLPDQPVQSVQDFPVPFTFRTPSGGADARRWDYALFAGFDIGNGVSGMTVLAPAETYAPDVTWQGQGPDDLVPAPTDAAGWEAWLDRTGHVDVEERRELLIGGAPATRFTLDLHDLPADYDCGGARRCLALVPLQNPHAGPSAIGSGAQSGIEEGTREMTVIELGDRAVVVLTTGKAETRDEWLPTLRDVVDSLRFA